VAGKARSSLNALKHGRNAHDVVKKLLAAGEFSEAALYMSIRRQVEATFSIECEYDLKQAERFSNAAYALARQARAIRTKLECPLFSARLGPRSMPLFRIGINDRYRRVGLVFWVQRKGFWTTPRLMATMFRAGTITAEPPLGQRLESRLRNRAFRLRRPGTWERAAYGLGEQGFADPTRKPRPDLQRLLNNFAGRWGQGPAEEGKKGPAGSHPAHSKG
jgi:hypothetical protein